MNVEPVSDEAKDAVWAAYEALDERQKQAITRYTAKNSPKRFKNWVRIADLAHGCDQRKVASRGGTYGVRLDKALKENDNGGFTADLFATFLMKTGTVNPPS